MSPTDSYAQHVVTAVIVAHDGAAWLQHLLDALNEQTRPVQRVVAVDTGSRDRSGAVLTAQLGQGAVFGMDRSTGYAAAVRRAVQHKAASVPVSAGARGTGTHGAPGRGGSDQVEWLWLLHDDCEPAADALEQLLRGAAEAPTAGVLGPKLMDWTDRDVVVEAGLALDMVGRRITGIEPREVDQGQHDGDRDALAVSSAGMLVRRDVWEQVGGFDPGMALFGEDVDFCWRVHAAGLRVRVITDAVVFHARAATKARRPISVGRRARLLDRRNGLVTLLGNLPAGPMLAALIGNLTLSLLRTVFYLVAKRPTAALDESAAVLGVVGHPLRMANARRVRARGRRPAYGALRGDLLPGRSIRRAAEFAASVLFRSSHEDLAGAHHASDDPDDDESLLTDSGVIQRLLTRPGVLLVLGLIAVAIAAERSVITSGTLGGGALVPAFEGASGLWGQFLQAYHPVGVGSASAGPPYVGLLALLATVLLGKAWLAIDVLLLGCVPLAGCTAFLALRRVTLSVPVRLWAAASYALLPVAFGAISAGRLGSAVAFVLIPVIGMLAGRMFSQPPKIARRAAWATGLAVTVGAAFVPLLWPMAAAGAVLAAIAFRRSGLANLAIVVLTPPVLLLPWLMQVLAHPARLLLEAGLQQPGLAAPDLPAKSMLLLSPGGPGLPPYWVSAALVLAGLAALLAAGRLKLVMSGWTAALLGFAAALLASRSAVVAPSGQPVSAWPGVPLAVAAAGLLLAAAAAADSALRPVAAAKRSAASAGRSGARRTPAARRFPVVILGLMACTAPVLAAAYWLMNGVSGPIGAAPAEIVPPAVSTTAGAGRELRTLVLTASAQTGRVSFLLLRANSPEFSYPDVSQVPSAQAALSKAVAALVAPGGGEAVNQSQQLARFDIGFVLIRAPIDAGLVSALDGVSGLTKVSMSPPAFDLWRLSILPSRVSVIEPSGAVVAVGSSAVGVSGAHVPAAGGTVLLSEPAGGWSAAVNGHALSPVTSPDGSWAQAFKLPPGGGTLTISRHALVHNLLLILYLLAFVVVAALALPGIRSTAEMEAAAAAAAVEIADTGQEPGEEADSVAGARGAADRQPARQGARRAGLGVRASGKRRDRAAGAARLGRGSRRDAARGDAPRGDRGEAVGQRDGAELPVGAGQERSGRRGNGTALPGRLAGRAEAGRSESRRAAAAAVRAGAGAVVAGTGVAGTGAAGTGVAGTGVAGTGAAGTRSAQAAAAWPAGQPVSRFVSDPPAARERPGDGRTADPYAAGADPVVRSATGTPYDEPPRRMVPSPSGTPYDEPAAGQPPADWDGGYDRDARYNRDAGYGPAGYGPSSYGPDAGRGGGYAERAYSEPGYPDPAGYGRQDSYSGHSYSGHSGGRAQDDQQSGWSSAGEQQGWPEDYQQPGSWPQDDQQHGWPRDHPAGPGSADRSWYPTGEEAWPDQPGPGGALEALPPDEEVHHDWSARRDRAARGWPAPAQDEEGEAW
ncbi:MAG TPA: glycosyltransferase [Streptosporangiaceae bacterium]|nr:glycosyltransferase [Streptosporangiaceae bacterium]